MEVFKARINFIKGKIMMSLILALDLIYICTNVFAGKAIAYLLGCDNDKLPKETLLALDPWE